MAFSGQGPTLEDFLGYFTQVLQDYMQKTGLVKKWFCLQLLIDQSRYVFDDSAMQVQQVLGDNEYLSPTTTENLDLGQRFWRGARGFPIEWHEDRLPLKTIEVVPIPNLSGFTVGVELGQPLLGTLAGYTNSGDFDLVTEFGQAMYGTIADIGGSLSVDVTKPLFGTISGFTASDQNLALLATARPAKKTYALDDPIDLLPLSLQVYLKYGVLAKIFSVDGETKDELRAKYCQLRYDEGIRLGKVIMEEGLVVEWDADPASF